MAIQLKDLFWSVEASLNQIKVAPEQQDNVTQWLRWLASSSYQQNIRFLRDQRRLRKALIQGELDWITCWSSNLKQLKEAMKIHWALQPFQQAQRCGAKRPQGFRCGPSDGIRVLSNARKLW